MQLEKNLWCYVNREITNYLCNNEIGVEKKYRLEFSLEIQDQLIRSFNT